MRFINAVRSLGLLIALTIVGLVAGGGIALAASQPGQLDPGDTLYPGQSLRSPSGEWTLTMQTDGNLVLYAPRHIAVAWSGTNGRPEVVLQMQTDGNLVLRQRGNQPIAASGTDGQPGTVLQVQDDGAVVLYAPGHRALEVVVPAPGYVNSPMPQDYVNSPHPRGDIGRVGGDSGDLADVGQAAGCAATGDSVGSRVPRLGPAVGASCGILTNDDGQDVDSYEVARTGLCAALRLLGPACDILTEADAAY